MSKSLKYKWLRRGLRILLGLLLLPIVIVGLLHLQPVQSFVAGQAESYLTSTLNTEVHVGDIDFAFPTKIALKDVFVKTPEGGDFISFEKVAVELAMLRLINQEVIIQSAEIDGLNAHIVTTDSSSSLDFIMQAFASDKTATVDTTAATAEWQIKLPHSKLLITDSKVYFQDDLVGILADVNLNELDIRSDDVSVMENRYLFDEILLKSADIVYEQRTVKQADKPAGTDIFNIAFDKFEIEGIKAEVILDSMRIQAVVPKAKAKNFTAKVGAEQLVELAAFELSGTSLDYDANEKKALPNQLDFEHLKLDSIQLSIADIHFDPDSLSMLLKDAQLSGNQGLALQKLTGNFKMLSDKIQLTDAALKTSQSSLESANFVLGMENGLPRYVSGDVNTRLSLNELRKLLPPEQQEMLATMPEQAIVEINTVLTGAGDQIQIQKLNLDAPGLALRANGVIDNPFDIERVAADIGLRNLQMTPSSVLPLLPKGTLPSHIEWPQQLTARGDISWKNDRLGFDLTATEKRRNDAGFDSYVDASGYISNVSNIDNAVVNIRLDTLAVSRATALAYMPPSTLPEGYKLPSRLYASGTANGSMQDMEVRIKAQAPDEGIKLASTARLKSLLNPDKLSYELKFDELSMDAERALALLPDSLLPANVKLPDFTLGNGLLSQDANGKLIFDLPITIEDSKGEIKGHFSPEDLNIDLFLENVYPSSFLQGSIADTVAAFGLAPLSLQLKAKGALEPKQLIDAEVLIANAEYDSLLAAQADIVGDKYTTSLVSKHNELQLSADGYFVDSLTPHYAGSFNLQYLSPKFWGLSTQLTEVEGKGRLDFVGLQLDSMKGSAFLESFVLRTDTSRGYIDSLYAEMDFSQKNKEANVYSDLLDFHLAGTFRPEKVFDEMVRFIQAYWRDEAAPPDPVVYGNYVEMSVEVKKSQLLLMGLVPGLTNFANSTAELIYREKEPEFLFKLALPYMQFQDIYIDSLTVNAKGSTALLKYDIHLNNLNVGNDFVLGETLAEGSTHDGSVFTDIYVYATPETDVSSDSLRHNLSFYLDSEPGTFSLILNEDQLINFNNWSVNPDNLIEIENSKRINIYDFDMRSGEQLLKLSSREEDQVFLTLENFDIETITRLVNSEDELLAGYANGDVQIDHPLGVPELVADVYVDSLSVLGTLFGKLDVKAEHATQAGKTDINASLTEAGNDMNLSGTVGLSADVKLALKTDVNSLQLRILEPFMPELLDSSQGYWSGDIAINGTLLAPTFDGILKPVDMSAHIPMLGLTYGLSGEPILLNEKIIELKKLTLTGAEGNTGFVEGKVIVNSLQEYDLDLHAETDNLLVLNTKPGDNELYYGRVAVDAIVDITGSAFEPVVDLVATPQKGSEITYLYAGSPAQQLQSTEDVLHFEPMYDWERYLNKERNEDEITAKPTGFELIANFIVTDDLEVTAIIDPVTGDKFVGRAKGDLNYRQFPNGEMEMLGKVEVVEGKYDFTYESLVSKEFTVKQGSYLNWSGNVLNPYLDMTIYFGLETTPYPLVNMMNASETQDDNLRRDQYFRVAIELEGVLEEVSLTTDVLYPNDVFGNEGYQSIEGALASLRNDQSRLNTQAFSLLLFESFMAEGDGSGGALIDVNAGISSILSNQLNSLANRYIKFVEVDVGVDTYEGSSGETNSSLRLSVKKRLLNDRLILSVDGVTNISGENDADQSQTYLDNITAEYLLTQNGDLRIKVFNDRSRQAFVGGDVVRVGSRFVFTKDFDTVDWFK